MEKTIIKKVWFTTHDYNTVYIDADCTMKEFIARVKADNTLFANDKGSYDNIDKEVENLLWNISAQLFGVFPLVNKSIPDNIRDVIMSSQVSWCLTKTSWKGYMVFTHQPIQYIGESRNKDNVLKSYSLLIPEFEKVGLKVIEDDEYKVKYDEYMVLQDEEDRKEEEKCRIEEEKRMKKEAAKRDKYKGKWYWATLSFNWADEMDVECHEVMKESEMKKFIKDCKKLGDGEINIYIGTNEDVDFSGNELADSVNFIEIPSSETREFLFAHCQVTEPTSINSIWERVCEENEANEDFDGEDLDDEED